MRKPYFTDAQIIKAGSDLEQVNGQTPTGWEVHKALGGKGNPGRVRDIWNARASNQEATRSEPETALPNEFLSRIDTVADVLRQDIGKIAQDLAGELFEEHLRQFSIQQRDHSSRMAELEFIIQELRQEVEYLEGLLDVEDRPLTAEVAPSDEPSALQAPAPVAMPQQAVRKSLNRPLKNTRRVQNKMARPALRTRQGEQREEQSRS